MPQPIVKIVDFAEYRDGSVVSREVMRKQTGSVTTFAFDKGEGLSEHTAPFDALVQVLEGETDIFIDGEAHRLCAGDLIVMPANHPHALKAVERFKMLLVMIRSAS